jgi:hypothetical protein
MRIWMRETVRMILIAINTTTTNCRTALECTQLNFYVDSHLKK